jgi:two-component system, NarL family, nitrate/nitrite response regulator NarL
VPNIGLMLRSRLVKDALSSVLSEAGFSVLNEPDQHNDHAIVIVGFDDYQNPETVLAHQQRGAKIVVLASETDRLELGLDEIAPLSGILTYSVSADAFVRSLRLICSGERVFPHDPVLERASPLPSPRTAPQPDGVRLSAREREVLLDLVEGHSNNTIARHLGMTEATVKVHLKSVLRKIRVDNRTQATIWALANLPELDTAPHGFV